MLGELISESHGKHSPCRPLPVRLRNQFSEHSLPPCLAEIPVLFGIGTNIPWNRPIVKLPGHRHPRFCSASQDWRRHAAVPGVSYGFLPVSADSRTPSRLSFPMQRPTLCAEVWRTLYRSVWISEERRRPANKPHAASRRRRI